jgi:hypothetical protein
VIKPEEDKAQQLDDGVDRYFGIGLRLVLAGFREVEASTVIATVPDALAQQGLLPPAGNPSACNNTNSGACVAVPISHR